MKDIFDGMGEAAKDLYDMLPFHDPDKKYQRALDKLKELKKRENDVYAEIGRRVYKEEAAAVSLLETEKLHRIYDERRAAELEVERLEQERSQAQTANKSENKSENKKCPRCGAGNVPDTKFCRECGQKLDVQVEAVCAACGEQNPMGARFCGFCGARVGEEPKGPDRAL